MDSRKPLKKLRRRQNQALSRYSEAIRSDLSHLDRLKFKAIVVLEIHARDVIEKMYRASEWSKPTRHFSIPSSFFATSNKLSGYFACCSRVMTCLERRITLCPLCVPIPIVNSSEFEAKIDGRIDWSSCYPCIILETIWPVQILLSEQVQRLQR